MSYLSYLSDDKFTEIVRETLLKAKKGISEAEKNMYRNAIDPFSFAFEMAAFEIDCMESWKLQEKRRQAQKTLQNQIGLFHQSVLGSISGWENMGTGSEIDLVNDSLKKIAEIKNKYNTVKGSDLSGLYDKLDRLVMQKNSKYKDYTAYYVEIIPKKGLRYNECFAPSDSSKGAVKSKNEKIRKIDGYSFYNMAANKQDALRELFLAVKKVICAEFEYRLNDEQDLERIFEKTFFANSH